MDVSRTTFVDAPPARVWALVSDLPGMGSLSPEANGGDWQGGATGPSVGAQFKGHNKNGSKSRSTVSTVRASEPGRLFTFDVKVGPAKVSTWSYVLEPRVPAPGSPRSGPTTAGRCSAGSGRSPPG